MTRRFGTAVVATLVSSGVFFVVGYVTHFLSGRTFGPREYGDLGVALAIQTSLNFLFVTGISNSVSREVAQRGGQSIDAIAGLVMRWNVLPCLAAAVLAAVVWPDDPFLASLLLASGVAFPAYSAMALGNGVLNGTRAFLAQSVWSVVGYIARLAVVLVACFLLHSPIVLMFSYAVGAATTAVLSTRGMRLGREGLRAGLPPGFIRAITAGGVLAGAMFVLLQADVLALRIVGGAGNALGEFVAGTTLARLPFYVGSFLALLGFPGQAAATMDAVERRRARLLLALTLGVSLALLSPVFLAPTWVVQTAYGPSFRGAGPLAFAMGLGGLALGVVGLVGNLLFAQRRTTAALRILGVTVLALVALAVWLREDPILLAWAGSIAFVACAAASTWAWSRHA